MSNLLVRHFLEMAADVKNAECGGAYHVLAVDHEEMVRWALVIGWEPGHAEDPEDMDYWQVCGKIAFQPLFCLMQFDYNVDWVLPYDKKTGKDDNTSIPIKSEEDVLWLLRQWERICKKQGLSYRPVTLKPAA